eukprot:350441-Chlamydomonas_euryale.AAC.4
MQAKLLKWKLPNSNGVFFRHHVGLLNESSGTERRQANATVTENTRGKTRGGGHYPHPLCSWGALPDLYVCERVGCRM